MRIGLIVPGFSAHEEDWCIPVLLSLVRRLSHQFQICVFPLRYPFHNRPYSIDRAQVRPLGGGNRGGDRRITLLCRALASVAAEHRSRPFDVLHAVWADEAGFVAAVSGMRLGIPSVVSLSGGELVRLDDIQYGGQRTLVNRWIVKQAISRATAVTVPSTYLLRLLLPLVRAERICRLPMGVDTDRFSSEAAVRDPYRLETGRPRLLHAASLVPVKDQRTLLSALPPLLRQVPSAHLHIVGKGPLLGPLQELAGSLGIDRHVTFHGQVPHDEMPSYYRSADLCVLSSRHEGQELVTLEAGACARSTIGTPVGVLPDLIPATRTYRTGDPGSLARVLLKVLSSSWYRDLGRQCHEKVQENYSLQRTLSILSRIYEQPNNPPDRVLVRSPESPEERGEQP